MIRELFHELGEATLEALKAAADEYARIPLEKPLPEPTVTLSQHVYGLINIMHDTLGDRTLRVDRDPLCFGYVFSHRCKLCNNRHSVRVDEEALFSVKYEPRQFVELLYNEVESLLQRPCPNMEIGKK